MKPSVISTIRLVFKFLYFVTVILTFLGGLDLLTQEKINTNFLQVGRYAGQASMVLFCITLLPGMFLRFGWRTQIVQSIRPFRGNIGILMYFCAITHYALVRFFLGLKFGDLFFWPSLFEGFGLTAFLFTLPVFITSNSYSLKGLKKWWKRIHALVYIIVWFIAFHIVLGTGAVWLKIVISTTAVAELASLIYVAVKKRQTVVAQTEVGQSNPVQTPKTPTET